MKSFHKPTFRKPIAAEMPHVFPPEGDPALDAIYISHRVVSGRHLSIARLAFDDVHPTSAYRVSFYAWGGRSTM